MRTTVTSLLFAAAVLQAAPAHAMLVRTALLINPGAELTKPTFKWPMAPQSAALKEKLDAFKGPNADEIRAFYALQDYRSVWISNAYWSERAKEMIARLGHAQLDGLQPDDYMKPVFTALPLEKADETQLAEAEVELSAAAVNFARHLSSGRVNPSDMRLVAAKPAIMPVSQILNDMAKAENIDVLFRQYEPPHEGYKTLRTALDKILGAEDKVAEKPMIPSGPLLEKGMRDERVPILRARFALDSSADAQPVMDAALVEAIRNFQEENGIRATGKLNKYTLSALNKQQKSRRPVDIADIVVNMERWRWLPRELGDMRVVVNIPEFLVRIQKNGKTTYEGRVVVGKENTPTPIFSDKIQYVVVNPSWNIPPSIVKKEMIPMLQNNPEEFFRRGYEVTQDRNGNYKFRQPPSARNALGRVKFIFPNQYDVYLHDTPAKGYFKRSFRAFSHGCVRVDNPMLFADALLTQEPKISAKRIQRLYGGEEQFLHLEKPIPVHLVYFTASASADGTVERRGDVYGLDSRLKSLMGFNKRG